MYFDIDGKQVFASTGGKVFNNKLTAVIFLQGSGLDHTFWGLHSRFFAFRNYSVVVPDLPGHTNSDGPALTSIESMADWLHDVVNALAIANISLVGHSQGCLVALEYAARFPKNLQSVSLIASGLATPVNDALIDAAMNKPEDAIAMMMSWGFGSAGHLHQGPIPGNSMIAGGSKVMRGNAPDGLASDLKACNEYKNGTAAAAKMPCPVQVILAGQDRMAPRKATEELVANLIDPEVHLISNSGHMLPLEFPNKCRQLLRSFVFENNPAA